MSRRLPALAVAAPVGVFLAVYLANAGHGFLLDDFDWILNSRVRTLADLAGLFGAPSGFYRPVVSVTFAANEWLFGLHPFGYALTNIGLVLACAAAVAWLARGFGLSRGAAALAGALWLLNLHFVRTSVLWISGRTALVVALAAVLCAGWLVRGRLGAATVALFLALLAKEEAVLLPVVCLAWLLIARRATGRPPVPIRRWLLASGAALAGYALLRGFTPAMTPATAPGYYRFTFDPAAVWRNVGEYADRTSGVAAAALVVAALLLGWTRPWLDDRARTVVRSGAVWLAGTLGFAYVLPVRSDLYAAVPCVGACLMAAALIERWWSGSTPARQRGALVAAVVLPLVLAPVYWQRAQRLARQASFSSAALDELAALTAALPAGATVWIDDGEAGPAHAPTMAAAFGGQLNAAYVLRTGRRLDLALSSDPPPDPQAARAAAVVRLALRNGRLQPMDRPRP
jgi:hypothetical protein